MREGERIRERESERGRDRQRERESEVILFYSICFDEIWLLLLNILRF